MLAKHSLAVLKRGIDNELFSGAAYALVSKRQSGGVGTLGRLAFDRETDRVNRDTLFDAASLTKPFATALAVLHLAGEGTLALDDSAAEILSAGGERLAGVTLRQLLTHTSGLPPVPSVADSGETVPDSALATPLEAEPGSRYQYSDTGYILLGEVVRRVAGQSVAEWFDGKIKPALHLESSGFTPDLSLPIAATADDEELDGLAHDPLARRAGGVAGHAGLFLSVSDLAAILRALLGNGRALLPQELFGEMFVNQIDGVGHQSLAFFTRGNPYLPNASSFSDTAVGHSGFTGCFVLIDRENEAAVGLLTNSVLSSVSGAKAKFLELRNEWLEAAALDLRLAPLEQPVGTAG